MQCFFILRALIALTAIRDGDGFAVNKFMKTQRKQQSHVKTTRILPDGVGRRRQKCSVSHREIPVQCKRASVIVRQKSSSYTETGSQYSVPTVVYRLNASTKWVVTVANTLGIWTRIVSYEGPFIVLGSILAVYFTDALKQVINHDRPAGAPFTDPGMPSSHSLVSFFMAAAWSSMVVLPSLGKGRVAASVLCWAGASTVAFLRVICGYHSFAQIGVGAALGSALGWMWPELGRLLYRINPTATFRLSWSFYILGSAFFIFKNMRHWTSRDKHV